MVEASRERLRGRVPSENLRPGDILDDSSYTFDDAEQKYQVIYAFDVVQQLPRQRQLEACLVLARRLAPGGCALVFDHDRWSRHGLSMGLRKFATKYLRLRLVPEYYCNARYPALSRIASKLATTENLSADVWLASSTKKRALVIRNLTHTVDAGPEPTARPLDSYNHGTA